MPQKSSDQTLYFLFVLIQKMVIEADPDRCIIADIHAGGLTGESMGKLGVAFSYHAYDPRGFGVLTEENQNDAAYLSTVQWPFTASDGITYDAETVLNSRLHNGVSANELAATAHKLPSVKQCSAIAFFASLSKRIIIVSERITEQVLFECL